MIKRSLDMDYCVSSNRIRTTRLLRTLGRSGRRCFRRSRSLRRRSIRRRLGSLGSLLIHAVGAVLLEVLAVAEHGGVDGDDEDLNEDGGDEIAQNDDDDGGSDEADDRVRDPVGAEADHDLHDERGATRKAARRRRHDDVGDLAHPDEECGDGLEHGDGADVGGEEGEGLHGGLEEVGGS